MKKTNKTLHKIILTLFITWLYCIVWSVLERIIDGQIVNRTVDNIIMVLFIPIIYISAGTVINKIYTKRRNKYDKIHFE